MKLGRSLVLLSGLVALAAPASTLACGATIPVNVSRGAYQDGPISWVVGPGLGGHFNAVIANDPWDLTDIYYAQPDDPPLPNEVRSIFLGVAGQQGASASQRDSTVTGQHDGYEIDDDYVGEAWDAVDGCGLFGRLHAASADPGSPLSSVFDLAPGGDSWWGLVFNSQSSWPTSDDDENRNDLLAEAWFSWLVAHGDPDVVEVIWLAGASRGGALVLRPAALLQADDDWRDVPLWVSLYDGVCSGDAGECGVDESESLDSPVADHEAWSASIMDSVVVGPDPTDPGGVRVFNIVGGEGSCGKSAIAMPQDERRRSPEYRQRWVDLDHDGLVSTLTEATAAEHTDWHIAWAESLALGALDGWWSISHGGAEELLPIREAGSSSGMTSSSYLFGDFTWDGKDDVVRPTGSSLLVLSSNETGLDGAPDYQSATLSTAGAARHGVGDYLAGDFDGDGLSELLTCDSTSTCTGWKVCDVAVNHPSTPWGQRSYSCDGGWRTWRHEASGLPEPRDCAVGDVQGDGRADVLHFTGSASGIRWYPWPPSSTPRWGCLPYVRRTPGCPSAGSASASTPSSRTSMATSSGIASTMTRGRCTSPSRSPGSWSGTATISRGTGPTGWTSRATTRPPTTGRSWSSSTS